MNTPDLSDSLRSEGPDQIRNLIAVLAFMCRAERRERWPDSENLETGAGTAIANCRAEA